MHSSIRLDHLIKNILEMYLILCINGTSNEILELRFRLQDGNVTLHYSWVIQSESIGRQLKKFVEFDYFMMSELEIQSSSLRWKDATLDYLLIW